MRILITGSCGFVGSVLAHSLLDRFSGRQLQIVGIDHLGRAGSWLNRAALRERNVQLVHGDIRTASDLESVPPVDWVIDAAANPSVLAGIDGRSSSRQLVEHNLIGTINLLELCKRNRAGFILISTSRVYSIEPLATLQMQTQGRRFVPRKRQAWTAGISPLGVTELGPVDPPVSLYGASKRASELLALEYGETYGFPVWINRCGVLSGAGQFGRPDQGIFAYWINQWLRDLPLKYVGYGGRGYQVRDCLNPRDLADILRRQMQDSARKLPRVCNFSGGLRNSMSLAELSHWCGHRFGPRKVAREPAVRRFDIPWMVLDHGLATKSWGWKPATSIEQTLEEIAQHAEAHPEWPQISQ